MGNKNLVIITLVILLAVGGFVFLSKQNDSGTFVEEAASIDPNSQVIVGDIDAPVQIVVFEDPNCPACKHAHTAIGSELVKNYVKTDPSQARWVSILLSFMPNSPVVANAAYCVAEAGSDNYYDFIDGYFDIQGPNVGTGTLLRLATETGLNDQQVEQVRQCMLDNKYADKLAANMELADKVMKGQVSTPRFFINGVEIEKPNYDDMAGMIENAQ